MADRGSSFSGMLALRRFTVISGETRFFVKHFSEKAIIDAGQAAPAISALSGLSRFYTLDMALDEAGRAFVVETGDGQVSECPGESASDLISALSML